jgi:amidase
LRHRRHRDRRGGDRAAHAPANLTVPIAEYGGLDALALADLVRRREVTPAELLEEAIARADRVNPRVNAIVAPLHEQARRDAATPASLDVPFAGVPLLLKDLEAAVAGVPLTAASRYLADNRPPHDATIVQRFRRAGCVIFGKTNLPELGITPFTESSLFGPARNPWNPELTPGGSSGGAAAAVAAGIVPVAHASDGGGSIRIPASCCGLFGLKPTRGRTPVGPADTQLWSGLAIAHVVSRSVRDSAAMLDAIAGPEPTSPYWAPPPARPFRDEVGAPPGRLRIALTKKPFVTTAAPHADCAAAADDAARLLAELGHHVEEADHPVDGDAFARDFFVLAAVEIAAILARAAARIGRPPRRGEIETNTAIMAIVGRQQTAVQAGMARRRLETAVRLTQATYEPFDLVLTPTLGLPPVGIGALVPHGVEAFAHDVLVALHLGVLLRLPGVVEAAVRRVFTFIPYTPLANVSGEPAMSVPLAWNPAGVPIGVQLQARLGDEATLLRVASQLEAARPWAGRRPAIHADATAAPAAQP